MKVNLLSKFAPAASVVKTTLAGDSAVIATAGVAAVVAGTTAATVLRDVYGVPQRRRRKNSKRVPLDSVPNPEEIDDTESVCEIALDDDIDPSDSI